jgi:hypothetical protein
VYLPNTYHSPLYTHPCIRVGEEEGDEPVILTDILGLEDALGTMDFKGTRPCLNLDCVVSCRVDFCSLELSCFVLPCLT